MYTIPDELPRAAGEPDDVRLVAYANPLAGVPDRNPVTLTRHVLSLVEAGEKRVYLPHQSLCCPAGSLLLLAAGRCLMSERRPATDAYRSTLLFFDDAHLQGFLSRYATRLPFRRAAGNGPRHPAFCFAGSAFLQHYFAALSAWAAGGKLGGELMLRLKIDELLLYLATVHPEAFGQFVAGVAWGPAAVFHQVVESPATQSLSLPELAFLCHMSLATFKRRFQATYGCSPERWRQQRRLQQAAQLLERPGTRPSDVFEAVGYESLSSFSHAFKQAFGYTPTQYQQERLSAEMSV
ncbi:AraC family transcriptional regulator [Hymenobacter sp. 15J16-1T3B]|uniref:helix-turn-helix domain-containing protein n=1 Tax=Hymenobacter sp. 15J16-1T3B TaxID=2886941 RepID=UPI001D0FCCC1|nr:AraC family transcriptional regulator [Hymenobacter sp. 15J16-1T3B]MCC3156699.1 AraC family transcriptional regulator [Hymenobacter sp. 15J16-1T3B]